MLFSGPFRYYSIFVLLFVTTRRFGGPIKIVPFYLRSQKMPFFLASKTQNL